MLLTTEVRKMLVDGTQWASWQGYHLPVSDEYFVIWTPAGTKMSWRPREWILEKHQLSYFWRDTWFTIHIGYDSQTRNLLSGYCDVILPDTNYTNSAREMVYTDLYIDVVIREDGSVYTKDHEVFERAAVRFPIVEASRQQAFESLELLESQAKQWSGPFAIMPRHLPRTDWELLGIDEIQAEMCAALRPNP